MNTQSEENPTEKPFRFAPDHIAEYYDTYGDKEWERLNAHPVNEANLHVHTHYLKEHIPAGAKVLEIGAGAGRFTQVLAELGAKVTVADISPGQIALNKQHAEELGFTDAIIDWQVADICDLKQFENASFDRIVAYGGPFSYVLDERDTALRACLRVLRPGGVMLLSVMSLWGTIHNSLKDVLSIPLETNRKIINSGDLVPETYANDGHYMHLFRAEELSGWLNENGLRVLAISAANALTNTWSKQLSETRQDETLWAELLAWELEASAQPGALDMGTHILAVVKKTQSGLARGIIIAHLEVPYDLT